MKIVKITDEQKRLSRLGGFKRKKPKKGSLKTEKAIDAYVKRYNTWANALKAAAKKGKAKDDKAKSLSKMKAAISGL